MWYLNINVIVFSELVKLQTLVVFMKFVLNSFPCRFQSTCVSRLNEGPECIPGSLYGCGVVAYCYCNFASVGCMEKHFLY
jgi:hypothetical protein